MGKIYTRTGDDGRASLFGGGRVAKNDGRLDAYGTLDELNAFLGLVHSRTEHRDFIAALESIQRVLFDIGSHLATPLDAEKAQAILPPLNPDTVAGLERLIDELDGELAPLTSFILPGGTEEAALLHVARTVCRRAERAVVSAFEQASEPPPASEDRGRILPYLNRLSDLLFVLARISNRRAGLPEPVWEPDRPAG